MASSSLSVKGSPHRRIPSSYWPPLLRSPRQGLDVRCATELKSLSPVPNANRTRECSACSRIVPQRNLLTSPVGSRSQILLLRRSRCDVRQYRFFFGPEIAGRFVRTEILFPGLTSLELEYQGACRRATERRQSSCFVEASSAA
jgi:hypothetical protein